MPTDTPDSRPIEKAVKIVVELKDHHAAPQSIEHGLSVLDGIRPPSPQPAKRQFRSVITGCSGWVLAFQVINLVTLLILLMVEGFINGFFPHQTLTPILKLLFLSSGVAYFFYLVIAGIVDWKDQRSLVHPDHIEKRKHAANDMHTLLARIQDIGILEEILIEVRSELEELRNTSSTLQGAIKEVSPFLLAVVALVAIQTNQHAENVSMYPMALALGSLAVILAFVLKFPVYRRIRLYSHWSYILEKAIHHRTETSRAKTSQ